MSKRETVIQHQITHSNDIAGYVERFEWSYLNFFSWINYFGHKKQLKSKEKFKMEVDDSILVKLFTFTEFMHTSK